MDVACSRASPGEGRRHGEAWKVLGGDVASTASAVAFHLVAWCTGRGRRPCCPFGPAGLDGPASPGRLVRFFLFFFCLIFPFCFSFL